MERCYKLSMDIKDAATATQFINAWKTDATPGRARRYIGAALEGLRAAARFDRSRGTEDAGTLEAIAVLEAELAPKLVGDVCLYGNSKIGIGWLATHAGGQLGDGTPKAGLAMTEAVWAATDALRAAGVEGMIVVYAPGGERYAVANLAHVPTVGSMTWYQAGPGVVVSAEQIKAAAGGGVTRPRAPELDGDAELVASHKRCQELAVAWHDAVDGRHVCR